MTRFLLVLFGLGLASAPAFAHKLIVVVTVTELAVNVEAKYEDGDIVPAGAKVAVIDKHRVELSTGVTDETGECRLPRPDPGVYTVSVDDTRGHLGEVVITVREGESTTARTTENNKWIMAGIGLAVIAIGTAVAMRWKKKPISPSP